MEENKNSSHIPDPTPLPGPQPEPPPATTPPEPKSLFNRLKKDFVIIFGLLLLVVLSFVTYQLFVIGKEVSKLPTACSNKQKQFQSSANELKTTLTNLRVDGQAAKSVTASPNGDCLTGSGAYGIAEFEFVAPNVTAANTQLLQDLKALTQTTPQTFNFGHDSSNAFIDFVSTNINGADRNYEVAYYLQIAIDCRNFGTPACQNNPSTNKMYDFMQKPVQKVKITLNSRVP